MVSWCEIERERKRSWPDLRARQLTQFADEARSAYNAVISVVSHTCECDNRAYQRGVLIRRNDDVGMNCAPATGSLLAQSKTRAIIIVHRARDQVARPCVFSS